MRVAAILTTTTVALIFASAASAVPPVLSSVGSNDRHPTATFSAPKSDQVVIEIATKPDRGTNGEFLSENQKVFTIMTDSEAQTGHWLYGYQLDPGTYYVLLHASPDFDNCYIVDAGTYDPSCADGYSDMTTLVVPRPATRYRVTITRESFIGSAELRLIATPLGEKAPYKVCYLDAKKKKRCLSGTLSGYDWDSPADDLLMLKTRSLAPTTTFTWTIAGKKVATKRARVR